MANNAFGIDLGTNNIKIYSRSDDNVLVEKNMIAIENKKVLFAYGNSAFEMYEKAPGNIHISYPLTNGVIADIKNMETLVRYFVTDLQKGNCRPADFYIAVPTDVTEVEKKAFFDLVIHSTAKAKEVNIVERSIADAIGLNLDVQNTNGLLIVNFGGETTEISVIAGGGMVMNRLLKIGGATFDQSVVNLVRHSHDFLIGRHTAEVLRKSFGIFTSEVESMLTVAGRDLITGVPMRKGISINLVRLAMKDPLTECVQAIQSMLERTPPEVRRAIHKNGIFLTGGVAHTAGLEMYVEEMIGIKTRTSVEPDICAVTGLKKIIQSKELRKFAFSMIDENYRWMR